ncbi:MAG: hypothetical protein KAU24_04755, partial [Candidatus Aenigmarchaeota archaeon]|nr:hypothetical protein [Candidatus Aenigmarchaeota archaeon]
WCDCNQTATGCNGLSCWGGTNAMSWESGTTQSCCGDDAVEYYNFRNEHFSGAEIWFDDDATDDACCNADGDCVYDGTCYASGVFDLNGDTFKEARCYTSSGTWINTDYHSSYCGLGGYNWDVGGGDATGDNYAGTWGGTTSGYCHNRSIEEGGGFVASIHCCCGDDSGENKITSTYGASIENPPSPSTDACCDVSTDCVNASTCYANSATLDVDSNGDDDVCSSVTWIDCTTVAHCDPAGEYAEGEGSQACYGSSDCNEACTSNDCIYKRYNGFSDCDLETACVSGNCMQDTEYAGTAAAGACDNTDGCICNTCGTWDTCIPSDGCPFDNDWDEIMSDCYNPADQGGNCYASSGDTNKDVDNDGDYDYCSSGTWYDCLNDNQCTAPYECVNNDCNNTIPSGSGTTCDAANPCLYVEDSSSVVKARFDDNGYVDIKGGLYENESGPLSCSTCFQIKDSGGTLRLYIDSNGNLYSLGYFITDSTPTPSGNNDFQIKDSGGTVVGFVDGATGNMYFKGNLHYN